MSGKVPEEMRQGIMGEVQSMRRMNQEFTVTGDRFDIPMPDRNINIVLYHAPGENVPLILGFHGGGFLFGGNAMNDEMWSAVARDLGADVASVEYRKSPDYQYQAAIDDAYDALIYLHDHADEYGFDPDRIWVMGCSAGANVATALCIYAKQQGQGDLIKRQILLYPFVDCATDPDSKGRGSLEGPIMYLFNELHCNPGEETNPLVSPICATKEELTGMPEAIFCMADNDNLKKEGYDYAALLDAAGVATHVTFAPNMPHGFFEVGFGPLNPADEAYLGDEVKRMVENGEVAAAAGEAMEFIRKNL